MGGVHIWSRVVMSRGPTAWLLLVPHYSRWMGSRSAESRSIDASIFPQQKDVTVETCAGNSGKLLEI